ncbi:MAG TPA: MBL fold metallo-hydrolase [Candidatus Acidoferrales bacterium]|nr:MBL fold metallo-hydrolase [Candidatus Acidoferrales bacterium]
MRKLGIQLGMRKFAASRKSSLPLAILLAVCLAGLMGLGRPVQVSAKVDRALFEIKKIGDGVYAAISPGESKAGANAGFVIGDDGVAVIDTFEDASAAKVLLEEIRKTTKLPIRFVVNTHYHIDHVAGNGVFAEAGAVIVAHRNVREWIHTENLKFFGAKITPDEKKMVESLVAPSVAYSDSLDLYLGSRRLALHFYPGHTGGDTVVEVPDAHAIFCGDLFWRKTLPNLIDASTDKWVATLEKLASVAPEGTFVPGHGDVGPVADVKDFRGYLVELRSAVAAAQASGKSGAEVVEAVLPDLQAKYGGWDFFKYFAKSNIADTAKELKGEKRVPAAAKD